jgi:hypothetical protein
MMVAMMMVTIPAQAQFSWGIKGGVNMGNNDLSLLKDTKMAFNMDNYTGFFIGPKAEVRIPLLGFGVEAAALYSHKGMSLTDSEKFRQNSFQIPLNIKYIFGLGNIANIFIGAGPEFGFNVGATSKIAKNANGDILAYTVKKSTLSINLGAGATLLKHVQLGINYNMPWGNTGDFTYIDAEELENAENIKNGNDVTIENVTTLAGTAQKVQSFYNNIMSGTIQLSVAYLF